MRDSLLDIAIRLQSSKYTGHSYMPVYEKLFAPLRDLPINLLELGVNDGNSMRLWLDYFSQAQIYGLDTSVEHCKREMPGGWTDPRLTLIACDASKPEAAAHFADESLDLIIDDASHIPEQQHSSFHWLWPKLRRGGLYIIEDVHLIEYVEPWKCVDGCEVIANFKDGFGNYRDDDILVILPKRA